MDFQRKVGRENKHAGLVRMAGGSQHLLEVSAC